MKKSKYPILEFDPCLKGIIHPKSIIKRHDIAEHCVVCFFQEVITKVSKEHNARLIKNLISEVGPNPVYEIKHNGKRLAFFHPGVGAPSAGAFLEEVIALGCRKFIACGGAGALDKKLTAGHIVVPHSAVRDEGTSYHYLPPSREVAASAKGIKAIEKTLKKHGIEYAVCKTWTTDGVYRETPAKIKRRKAEGCLTVEMESAAFFAVAKFNKVLFAQMLYSGDDVSGNKWDSRHWQSRTSVREKLFWLAAEACLKL
jgi:uridine phosphorylase